jgi:hypothetical protein
MIGTGIVVYFCDALLNASYNWLITNQSLVLLAASWVMLNRAFAIVVG